jgi:scyllo-inositol 2-dehydrogenase (NADP+)
MGARDTESVVVITMGVVGLGKMGLSHLSIFRAHPDVDLVAVCDSTGYVLDVLSKYTGLRTYKDLSAMLAGEQLDAVVIATPSHLHAPMVRKALEAGVHVFCEKPFTLDDANGAELTTLARERGLVTQVGYHNRFVAAFAELKRLIDAGALGAVTHVVAEAYGPVVLAPKGGTWRSRRSSGGGCLYDYAAHPIDLVQWYLGEPQAVSGSRLNRIFSAETDDEVVSTLLYPDDVTAQVSVNWSDESQRKMTTKISIWGTRGRAVCDRQELQVYLRDTVPPPDGYRTGWTVRYTTELTEQPWFYLRGEEYSAQADAFVDRVSTRMTEGLNVFSSAAATDRILSMISADAQDTAGPRVRERAASAATVTAPRRRRLAFGRRRTA